MINHTFRKATKKDASEIFKLIKELAEFQGNLDSVKTTVQQIEEDGWGKEPAFEAILVEDEKHNIMGMALCFIQYSTWTGKCLYLEDLIISKNYRGKGIGKILFNHLLEDAKKRGFKAFSWQVLDTNTSALAFYKKFDATLEKNWYNGKIIFNK